VVPVPGIKKKKKIGFDLSSNSKNKEKMVPVRFRSPETLKNRFRFHFFGTAVLHPKQGSVDEGTVWNVFIDVNFISDISFVLQ